MEFEEKRIELEKKIKIKEEQKKFEHVRFFV